MIPSGGESGRGAVRAQQIERNPADAPDQGCRSGALR
jgi:hypothetical protein